MPFFKPSRNARPFNVALAIEEADQLITAASLREASNAARQIIKKAPEDPRGYYLQSIIKLKTRNYTEALENVQLAILKGGQLSEYLNHRGVVYFQIGAYQEAIADYDIVISQSPDMLEAYINRSLATWEMPKALKDLSYVLSQNKDHEVACANRAALYMKMKQNNLALADYQQLLTKDPQSSIAQCHVGLVYQAMNQHETAMTYFDKAIQIDSTSALGYSHKGYSLYQLKRYDEAAVQLKIACSKEEQCIPAHYNYAVLLRQVGQHEEAMKYFGLAMKYQLDHERAAEKAAQNAKQRLSRSGGQLVSGLSDVIESTGAIMLKTGTTLISVAGTAAAWGANAGAPGAGIGVSAAVELALGVFEIGFIVLEQIYQAQANKAQCERLKERVVIVCSAVMGLDIVAKAQQYMLALRKLEATLKQCQILTEKFSSKRWFQKVIMAGTHRDEFAKIYEELRDSIQLLNLGLNAQQIINSDDSKKDEAIDSAALQQDMQHILQLNMDLQKDMQQLAADEEARHQIINQQLASLQNQFDAVLAARPPQKAQELQGLRCIPIHDLLVKNVIFKGKLGKVYSAELYGEPVVAKEIIGLSTEKARAQFLREARIMTELRSSHFSLFYGICYGKDTSGLPYQYLVMEHFPKGTLTDYIKRNPELTILQRCELALGVAEGLGVLHRAGVYHRNVSGDNAWVNVREEAKLADFGLAKVAENVTVSALHSAHEKSVVSRMLSPEMLKRTAKPTPEKQDIYSFGVLLWEVMTGKEAYSSWDENQFTLKLLSGEREKIPVYLPQQLRTLIQACWHEKISERPAIEDVLTQLREVKNSLFIRPSLSVSISPEVLIEALNFQGVNYEKQKRYPKAFECYSAAAEQGSLSAQANWGALLCRQRSNESPDFERAFLLFAEAAAKGHARSMLNLAELYLKGRGTTENKEKAIEWLKESSKKGNPQAAARLKDILANEGSQMPSYLSGEQQMTPPPIRPNLPSYASGAKPVTPPSNESTLPSYAGGGSARPC